MYGGIWNTYFMRRSMQEYVSVRSPAQVLASRLLQMNRKECQKIEKDNVSADRSINLFPYRLHNETLGKKINSTHDCQDYYNSLGVEISRNFTTSALLRIYSKRMAVTNQPLCQPSLQAFLGSVNSGVLSIAASAQKCDLL